MLWIKKLCLLGLLLTTGGCFAEGKLALIIDDVGYNKTDIDVITLEGQLTYSVLPHTPFAKIYAQMARKANKEVMLHIPMESLAGRTLGPGALMTDMNKQQIDAILTGALQEIPFAKGINNHMGSMLTQKSSSMAWTMDFLLRHDLFFVDSMTSRFSVAEELAGKVGVDHFHRNVFIDNELSEKAMMKQFNLLVRIAQKYNRAIGIAHPYPETVKFLAKHLPGLKARGVVLVPMSDLLPARNLQLAKTSTATIRSE